MNADFSTGLRLIACATMIAEASVARVSRGGSRSARTTKNPSSSWKVSDSSPRNTTTGESQLPTARTPIVTATTHWLMPVGPAGGWFHAATHKVNAPPMTEAATMAHVVRGMLTPRSRRHDRHAWTSSPGPYRLLRTD